MSIDERRRAAARRIGGRRSPLLGRVLASGGRRHPPIAALIRRHKRAGPESTQAPHRGERTGCGRSALQQQRSHRSHVGADSTWRLSTCPGPSTEVICACHRRTACASSRRNWTLPSVGKMCFRNCQSYNSTVLSASGRPLTLRVLSHIVANSASVVCPTSGSNQSPRSKSTRTPAKNLAASDRDPKVVGAVRWAPLRSV